MWEKACPAVVWEGTERERESGKKIIWGRINKINLTKKIFDSIFSHITLPDTTTSITLTT